MLVEVDVGLRIPLAEGLVGAGLDQPVQYEAGGQQLADQRLQRQSLVADPCLPSRIVICTQSVEK